MINKIHNGVISKEHFGTIFTYRFITCLVCCGCYFSSLLWEKWYWQGPLLHGTGLLTKMIRLHCHYCQVLEGTKQMIYLPHILFDQQSKTQTLSPTKILFNISLLKGVTLPFGNSCIWLIDYSNHSNDPNHDRICGEQA